MRDAEDGKSIDDMKIEWLKGDLELAYDIIEHEDQYLELPSQFDIHEYSIMEDFRCGPGMVRLRAIRRKRII